MARKNKILYISHPDEETLAFWRNCADDRQEYFARIAKFSRALGKNGRSLARSPAVDTANAGPPGRLLLMPDPANPQPAAATRRTERNANRLKKERGEMIAPGVKARKTGTKLKRGAALQVMVYPRRKTKGVLVDAARDMDLTLSSFLLLAGLKEAAALQGCDMASLVAPDELERYRSSAQRKRSPH